LNFEDNFSRQAKIYAQYRPQYPPELFAYLASLAPGCDLAWDCGAGSGQAALGLAQHFRRVWATDASSEQVAQAQKHARIAYLVASAHHTPLPNQTVDLVTAAQAIHWFDLEGFYAEVRRALKPGGVLAAWTYHLPQIAPEIDALLATFFSEVVGPYWSPRIRLVNERYQTLPFPFRELAPPDFEMRAAWELDGLLGFLDSWSATQKFIEKRGYHPIAEIRAPLARAWGAAEKKRPVRWPLYFRIGVSQP
jgi:SAM-dependent methyltransferase